MQATIDQTAQQWVTEEIERHNQRAGLTSGDVPKLPLSPVSWVLPRLLRIVYQNTAQPVEVLGPLIRDMLHEQLFATTGGDPCNSEHLEASIDHTVAILVRVLERVRRHCLSQAQAG